MVRKLEIYHEETHLQPAQNEIIHLIYLLILIIIFSGCCLIKIFYFSLELAIHLHSLK